MAADPSIAERGPEIERLLADKLPVVIEVALRVLDVRFGMVATVDENWATE